MNDRVALDALPLAKSDNSNPPLYQRRAGWSTQVYGNHRSEHHNQAEFIAHRKQYARAIPPSKTLAKTPSKTHRKMHFAGIIASIRCGRYDLLPICNLYPLVGLRSPARRM